MTLQSLLDEAQTLREPTAESLSIGVIAPMLRRRGYDVKRVSRYDHHLPEHGETTVTSVVMDRTEYARNTASFDQVDHLACQGRYGDLYTVSHGRDVGPVVIEEDNKDRSIWGSVKAAARDLVDQPTLTSYNTFSDTIDSFLKSSHHGAELLPEQQRQAKHTVKQAYDLIQTFDEAMMIAPNGFDIHVDNRRHSSYEVIITANAERPADSLPRVEPSLKTSTYNESLQSTLRRVSTEPLQPYTVRARSGEEQVAEHKARLAPKLSVAEAGSNAVNAGHVLSVPLPYPAPWTQRT